MLAEFGVSYALVGHSERRSYHGETDTTVAAKARTMRERMSADSELEAASVTERMSLPSVLLVVGFLIFLCYPAIVAVFQISK